MFFYHIFHHPYIPVHVRDLSIHHANECTELRHNGLIKGALQL